ncbi:hypothetical protein M758_UG204400 [Ceratodon purpureus]|nr:hypothetical protein M758_UG204400 [Ceratodon purpureus]
MPFFVLFILLLSKSNHHQPTLPPNYCRALHLNEAHPRTRNLYRNLCMMKECLSDDTNLLSRRCHAVMPTYCSQRIVPVRLILNVL